MISKSQLSLSCTTLATLNENNNEIKQTKQLETNTDIEDDYSTKKEEENTYDYSISQQKRRRKLELDSFWNIA